MSNKLYILVVGMILNYLTLTVFGFKLLLITENNLYLSTFYRRLNSDYYVLASIEYSIDLAAFNTKLQNILKTVDFNLDII